MTRNVNDLAAMERLLEADVAIVTRDNGGTIDRIHQTATDGEYAVIREEASVSLANTIVDVDAAIERLRPGPGVTMDLSLAPVDLDYVSLVHRYVTNDCKRAVVDLDDVWRSRLYAEIVDDIEGLYDMHMIDGYDREA